MHISFPAFRKVRLADKLLSPPKAPLTLALFTPSALFPPQSERRVFLTPKSQRSHWIFSNAFFFLLHNRVSLASFFSLFEFYFFFSCVMKEEGNEKNTLVSRVLLTSTQLRCTFRLRDESDRTNAFGSSCSSCFSS